ncbi:unnamed protein product [Pieris brassicae]|uniref:Uncharacterized protein n=1 Tax=Pieris brassicae TaxID=7116 RepID=A0A9P0TF03_PIEBR|nr:unnamed protein product [Pieris brassicae]
MIRFLIALLLAGYVLSVPVDSKIKEASEVSTPAPARNLDTTKTGAEKSALTKDSDLETEPSVWFSYHHSIHSVPAPLIIPRPRVYASYYADYAPYYSYWNTW